MFRICIILCCTAAIFLLFTGGDISPLPAFVQSAAPHAEQSALSSPIQRMNAQQELTRQLHEKSCREDRKSYDCIESRKLLKKYKLIQA